MSKNTRSRKYLLTINNPQQHGITTQGIKKSVEKYAVNYYCYCAETGGNGTYHYHIFIYYKNAIAFLTMKQNFPTANIVTAVGNSAQNRNYILKNLPEHNKQADGSYEYKDSSAKIHKGINHSDTFYEFGECPDEHQGRRSDLEYMYSLVKEGYTNAEILEMCAETAIKHIDKLNKLRHAYLVDKFKGQRRLDLKVHYVFGKTGTGKSRDILDEHGDENCYRITDYNHPFDSYQCEPVIVFEEFRSSLRLQDMLLYLDIYPVILPARFSPRVGCFTTVYVVSNWDFESQFSELQKDPAQESSYKAWIRRFTGQVKIYTDEGIITYPTMQEYLHRFKKIPEGVKTPFDTDENPALMPFDD